MSKLRRSLVINFFSSSGATLLQFIVSILLARMLTPGEIGVFSMAVVFVNIGHIFRDFGVGSYLQREPDLTTEKIRSAIGVMFASTWTISAILYCSAQYIGNWFHEPKIIPIIHLMAIGFLIIPFGAVTNAMLTRELAADKQAVVSAAGTISYCASCAGLAALGMGTMSIAWANLISNLVAALFYIPFRPPNMPWLPSLRHWRSVANFGLATLVTNCLNSISNSLPDLLLGKLSNSRSVGLFSRANSTVAIFTYVAGSTISYGATSYMAQTHHRGEPLAPLLGRATALLTGIAWPAYALTALFGADIIVTLYGDKWLDCVPAIFPLTIAVGISMLFEYSPVALAAIGRPFLSALPASITLITRVTFAFALFDGSLATYAWGICAATVVTAPAIIWQQSRYLKFGLRQMIASVRPSFIVMVICVAGGAAMRALLPASLSPMLRLMILMLPLAALWYGALRLTGHQLVGEVHHLGAGLRARFAPAG